LRTRLGTRIGLILVVVSIGTAAQSVRPKNQAEQDACNAAINYNLLSRKWEVPLIDQAKSFLVVKHALLFDTEVAPTGDKGSGTDSMPQGRGDLKPDIDALLSFVWELEMNVIRKIYSSDLHKSEVPHLAVHVLTNSGPVAQACADGEDTTTIQLSDLLVKRLREESFQQAITEQPGPKPFKTEAQLLKEITNFRPLSLTAEDFLHSSEAYEQSLNVKVLDAWSLSRIANSIYVRAVLFVLAHEASHVWFDHCQPPPDETRADDYGLLVSTTWAAEQFQFAVLKAQLQNSREKLIAQKQQERKEAQAKLKRGLKPDERQYRADLETIAGLTNDEIIRSVDEDLGANDAEDMAHPLGRLGFETFTLVYEKAGITGDDATHPALNVRQARLEKGYKDETLEGEKILHEMYGGKKNFKIFVEQNQQQRANEMLDPLFDIFEIDGSKHAECEIKH
jgi:hypothetical protein